MLAVYSKWSIGRLSNRPTVQRHICTIAPSINCPIDLMILRAIARSRICTVGHLAKPAIGVLCNCPNVGLPMFGAPPVLGVAKSETSSVGSENSRLGAFSFPAAHSRADFL